MNINFNIKILRLRFPPGKSIAKNINFMLNGWYQENFEIPESLKWHLPWFENILELKVNVLTRVVLR